LPSIYYIIALLLLKQEFQIGNSNIQYVRILTFKESALNK